MNKKIIILMAKFGEGDPRWIVEERPDAHNVNNWHWTEKNASQWSKNKLTELLVNLKIDEPGLGECTITELSSIEGEAFVNNRKAKLIFFYEWQIIAKWKGYLNGQDADAEVTGKIDIPNFSEENDIDEIDIQCSIKTGEGTISGDVLKELMRNKGANLIRDKLAIYIKELKEDFAKDLILPTKDSKPSEISIKHIGKSQIKSCTKLNKINLDKESSTHSNDFKSLELKEELKCAADDAYNTIIRSELVTAFTRSKADIDPTPGGKFTLFDGNISGTFVSLENNKFVKQKWRYKSWPEDYFSDVTITLDQQEDKTVLTLLQTGIPSNDFERTEIGWKTHYFESMKRTFGFGATLY